MKRHKIILILVILSSLSRESSAFWGSDSTNSGSGLNVAAGYDVNTITTVSGSVITPPERNGQEQHAVMFVAAPQGTVTVVLGPWWFWEKQTITIAKKQNLTITGSLAQGKDGLIYVFAQRLENSSSGETVLLRSESGKPLWSGVVAGDQNANRQSAGNGSRPGAGNRGSGMRGGRR